MATEVKVPNLPESVSEATISEWLIKPGDAVKRDQNIADLETDKVVLEVPAPADGVISDLKVEAGATVLPGDVIALFDEGAKAESNAEAESKSKQQDEDEQAAQQDQNSSQVQDNRTDKAQEETDEKAADIASPAAQKLLTEHKLSAADIEGSGKQGRITKGDVLAVIEDKQSSQQPQKQPEPEAKSESKSQPEPRSERHFETAPKSSAEFREREHQEAQVDLQALGEAPQQRPQRRVPMTRIRTRIAERLLDVTQNTAMLTTFNEVDMHKVIELRKQYKQDFQDNHDVRLGFMSFFVKAAVEALKRFPGVNASIDGGDIVYHGFYDVGMAVSSPRGLLVPVIRDADELSYAEIETTINDFGTRAQDGKITLDELTGGTFTITNGGVFGSWLSTPILNPPQAAILGMHAINKRPVVVDDEIVIRPVMMLALSYDHRVIDGRDAVLFLKTIKQLIEDPARLMLQI